MKVLTIIFFAVLASFGLQSQAAEINEQGTIVLSNVDSEGDGDLSIGSFTFTVASSGGASFTSESIFNNYMYLFDSDNNVLIHGGYDSEKSDAGDLFNTDAGFEYDLTAGEVYKLTIGYIGYEQADALSVPAIQSGVKFTGDGAWSVKIVSPDAAPAPPAPVPLPAGLPLFISALVGLGLFRRK